VIDFLNQAIAGITSVHLSGWIAIAGVVCVVFATIVPNLSALRYISGLSLLLSLFYTVVAIVVSIQDGKSLNSYFQITLSF
jgi:hypothetical protein